MVEFQKAGAIGTPEFLSEEATKVLDQERARVGEGGHAAVHLHQLEAFPGAAGKELVILRLPSLAGKATERKAWYKASMLYSASAKTKHPEEAVKFINWLVNSPESANIGLAQRGVPANTEVPTWSAQAVAGGPRLNSSLTSSPTSAAPIAPLPDGGTLGAVMLRHQTDVLFERTSTADAASTFVDEVKSNLSV